ncbi:lysylphosphatidylglycerol synthase transmembrane domain-containing protein [Belliella buryatensis]|uniref:lysylphosphatidylglycerol synthase transmembrane domain-containing protein n=1 Tax=Belliella buryatensis TaxID=1500549 RepID=UPI000B77BA88|nr:lysylphosphatidylglycerol synthase transmembrane domain-containing protein [Belliella buryatensis]
MKLSIKQWIQILLSLGVAIWIFWFLYKDISIQELAQVISEVSWTWMGASILIALWGFWLRAWRWKLMIDANEQSKVKTVRAFWALMIGYLANLIIPRAGEIARCGVLQKTEGSELGKLLGTVILERTIDLLFMASTIFLAFFLERSLFLSLIADLVSLEDSLIKISNTLPLFIGGLIIAFLFFYFLFKRYRDNSLIKKLRHFIRDLIKGVSSVSKVKNQVGFWASSITIWFTYYFTMYTVALAIPSTASLSPSSVLMVMVMGSIGMIAPVQGGIGTFHALVAFILIRYGLSEEQGKIFAAIIHGSQVLTIIAIGLLALGIFFKITANKEPKTS